MIELVLLFLLTLLAFYLRFRNLGSLGFHGDEELTGLAVRGLLESGQAEMPSGMGYRRGLLYTYLAAWSASVLDDTAQALRLPSVVFSTLKIPLVYWFGRRLFGREAGLVAALVMTFSAWDIGMSRLARMYSMFGFFYLLSLYSFYRGFIEGHRGFLFLTLPLSVVTVLTHMMGLFLVGQVLVLLFYKGSRGISTRSGIGLFLLLGVVDFFLYQWINLPYVHQAAAMAALSGGDAATSAVAHSEFGADSWVLFGAPLLGGLVAALLTVIVLRERRKIASSAHNIVGVLLALLLAAIVLVVCLMVVTGMADGMFAVMSGLLSRFHMYPLVLLQQLVSTHLWWYLSLLVLVFMAVVFATQRGVSGFRTKYETGMSVALVLVVLLQSYGLAMLLLVGHVVRQGQGIPVLWARPARYWLLMLAISFCLWFYYGLVSWQAAGDDGTLALVRQIIKSMVFNPAIELRTFFQAFPYMTAIVLLGCVYLLDRHSRDRSSAVPVFVLVSLFVPLAATGLMNEWPQARYSYHLYPLLVLVYAWCIVLVYRWVIGWTAVPEGTTFAGVLAGARGFLQRWRNATGVVAALLLLLLSSDHAGLAEAIAVSDRGYGSRNLAFLNGYGVYPDHKGAADFVRSRRKPGDVVIAEDLYQQTYYLGRVDYKLGSSHRSRKPDRERDIYTGVLDIREPDQLRSILASASSGVWIITSAEKRPGERIQAIGPEIAGILDASAGERVFTGRDKLTHVYYFPGWNRPLSTSPLPVSGIPDRASR